ncbi:efflux RND transporter permease subunit, partial [Streptococcus pneumoniae]|uniref:efflux RND transporter permease subunit n=2 Tax=Bacteria TaxID=2 RepID=UPI0022E0ECA5
MAKRQQALAKVVLANPAVESISSTIGIDGSNTSLNSGRLQINLKPFDQRDDKADVVIKQLQQAAAQVAGIQLYMQPAQDLTVNDQVTPSQYQFTLDDADSENLVTWSPRLVAALQKRP